MNKKILLGSILSVAMLVFVSFTGVVGYQTTKSSTIARASPLFSIRSKRAIDEESKDIACDYVGKGEETNIHLSGRMKRAERVQKAVDVISKMDDRVFSRFVTRIILNLKYQEQKDISDVLQALFYIRGNPNDMKYYDTKDISTTQINCEYTLEYITCYGFPGCIFFSITGILGYILLSIVGKITSLISCYPIPTAGCCDAL